MGVRFGFPQQMSRVFLSICPTLRRGGGGGGCENFWVGGFPTAPPPPRVGHCGGLWVSAKGTGQGLLPVVRHFACGSWVGVWVGGCPIPPPPPRGGGTFVGLWVCQQSVVGGSLTSPPAPPRWLRKALVRFFLGRVVCMPLVASQPAMSNLTRTHACGCTGCVYRLPVMMSPPPLWTDAWPRCGSGWGHRAQERDGWYNQPRLLCRRYWCCAAAVGRETVRQEEGQRSHPPSARPKRALYAPPPDRALHVLAQPRVYSLPLGRPFRVTEAGVVACFHSVQDLGQAESGAELPLRQQRDARRARAHHAGDPPLPGRRGVQHGGCPSRYSCTRTPRVPLCRAPGPCRT